MPHIDADAARAYKREYRARQAGPNNVSRMYGIPAKDESGLPGEALLVAAFLRLKVADARRQILEDDSYGEQAQNSRNARAFLRDTEAVTWWAHLMGADPQVIQARLLQAAGMELHTI